MTHTKRPHLHFYLVLAVTVLALVFAAGGVDTAAAQSAQIPTVSVEAFDYGFEVPAEVEAGLTAVELTNTGEEPHHAQIVRLRDDVTLDDFNAALQEGPEALLPLVHLVGGPGAIVPGGSARAIVDLEVGTHVLLCFIEDADGVPHVAHGMVQPFKVVESMGEAATPPEVDLTVEMHDFHFGDMPTELPAGQQVWHITNAGPQPHEMNLLQLTPGSTMDDVATFMETQEGPPPAIPVGGFQAIDAGLEGWVELDLEAGATYVAVCFIPDPESGQPHVELGMINTVSVGEAPETLPETGAESSSTRTIAGILVLAGFLVLFARSRFAGGRLLNR